MKKSLSLSLSLVGLFLFSVVIPAYAFVDEAQRDNHLQSSHSPPIIENVVIEPEQPTSKDEVKVKATVYNNSSETDDKTSSVTLFYSVDKEGKTWEKVEMEQSEGDEKVWTATIPPQEAGATVKFYLQATDTSNNLTSETPGTVSVQDEKNWLPDETRMALLCDDKEDDSKSVPGHLDLKKIYAGYDDKYFYAKIMFEGKVPTESGECAAQPLYYLQAENADKGWLHYGWLYYRPCPFNNGPNQYGFVQKDWWNEQVRDSKQVDQMIKNNVLYWRWKRDFPNSPKNALWLYFEDRSGVPPEKVRYYNDGQLQDIKVYVEALIVFWAKDIYNHSPVMRLHLTAHSYAVK